MNPFIEEYLVEERHRNIRREMSNIRMEEEATRARVFRPNIFTRAMQNLGQWLIGEGERLVNRYDAPESAANNPVKAVHAR